MVREYKVTRQRIDLKGAGKDGFFAGELDAPSPGSGVAWELHSWQMKDTGELMVFAVWSRDK